MRHPLSEDFRGKIRPPEPLEVSQASFGVEANRPDVNSDFDEFAPWLTNIVNDSEVSQLLTRLYAAGLDFIWIFESVYLYCLPRPTEVDNVTANARQLAHFLPGYIKRLRNIAKQLRQYKRRAQSPLLRGMLDLPTLITQQASRLENQLLTIRETARTHPARTIYLLRVEAHLRNASQKHHKSYAALAPLITAGFSAFGKSQIYSEDRVRRICERFKKSFPEFVQRAAEAGREREIRRPPRISGSWAHLTPDDILKLRRKRHI